MFAIYCPTRGSNVLILPSDIIALRNTEHGTEVHLTCACTEPAVVLTGKRAGTTRVLRHGVPEEASAA
ncbi:MAG: hypothetical protein GEU96_18195 [Propionibacteriales bacterium]|nr:hypothetical protein [Propionibacteriales bacterium]